MFSNIFVLAIVVVTASCHDHHHHHHHPYTLKLQKIHKVYKHHPYEHQIRVQPELSSSEEYKLPEGHEHLQEQLQQAYLQQQQSTLHQGESGSYQASHETESEHVAPVYQYVSEQSEEVHQEAPKHQLVQYPVPAQHEFKTVRIPAHYKTPSHYQQESHEEQAYHYPVTHHAQESDSHEHDEPIDYYAYPKYQYEYKVEDPHTGDNKFQHEIRDGDVVKGVYGLHEADGSIRTVEYSSDKHHGFNAIVKHSAPGQHVHIESHHQD